MKLKLAIKVGFDALYIEGGVSIIKDGKEVFSAEIRFDKNVSQRIHKRAMYRRNRRTRQSRVFKMSKKNRSLFMRRQRFSQQDKQVAKGWIPPSLEHKLESHHRLLEELKQIIPFENKDVTVEIAKFDAQKMMNPDIRGVEYQHGDLFEKEVKEYLLELYHRTCPICLGKGIIFESGHIDAESRGGTNRLSNLFLVCHDCNQDMGNMNPEEYSQVLRERGEVAKAERVAKLRNRSKKSLKSVPFMNYIRKRLVDMYGYNFIYGYETKARRSALGLEKSHVNDAFVIAGGTNETLRCKPVLIRQVRRHNRCLQKQMVKKIFKDEKGVVKKGQAKHIQYNLKHYAIRLGDIVEYNGKEYLSHGTSSNGYVVYLENTDGKVFKVKMKDIKFIRHGQGFAISFL